MAEVKSVFSYEIRPPEPKVLPKNYTQGIDNLSSEDFLKIYLQTLRYQDPFQSQDLSKMLEDMTRINQIKHMNEVKSFLDKLRGWLSQMTLLFGASLVGKEFVFSAETLDTTKDRRYYLISSEEIKDVVVRVMDQDRVVKEFRTDLKRGLNPLDLSGLAKGQFSLKVFKSGLPVEGVTLGFQDRIKSVGILGGQLSFELEGGEWIQPSRLIHMGGA